MTTTVSHSLLLLIAAGLVLADPHRQHHHGHHSESRDTRDQPESRSRDDQQQHYHRRYHRGQDAPAEQHQPCGCGAKCAGMGDGPAQGVPLFLFPDHAQRAVNIVLRAEVALHRDNVDLASHLFHLLSQQFPRKWFIVGVGTQPRDAQLADVLALWSADGADTLSGTVPLHTHHTYNLPFFDGPRGGGHHGQRFQRENGSYLWYFVHTLDPYGTQEAADEPSLTSCTAKRRCILDTSLEELCEGKRQLGMVARFARATEASIWTSEPLAFDTSRMALVNRLKRCNESDGGQQQEVELDEEEDKRKEVQHILMVAMPQGKTQQ